MHHTKIKRGLTLGAAAAAFALFSTSSFATTLNASDLLNGGRNNIQIVANDGGQGNGELATKSRNGVTAVGVKGGSALGEIDSAPSEGGGDGQSVTAQTVDGTGFVLRSTQLAFLFDGSEYGDPQEVARLTANFIGGGSQTVEIKNVYKSPNDTVYAVDGDENSDLILNSTQSTSTIAGEITLGMLFGDQSIESLAFAAGAQDDCGAGACTNASDYGIARISAVNAVPAPSGLGLLVVGLGLVGIGVSLRGRRLSV